MVNEKTPWGGKRENAGRKPTHGKRITLSVRVSEEAKARLDAFCSANGCSQSDGIEKILRAL